MQLADSMHVLGFPTNAWPRCTYNLPFTSLTTTGVLILWPDPKPTGVNGKTPVGCGLRIRPLELKALASTLPDHYYERYLLGKKAYSSKQHFHQTVVRTCF